LQEMHSKYLSTLCLLIAISCCLNKSNTFSTMEGYVDVPYFWRETVNSIIVFKNCITDLFTFFRSTIQLIWRNYNENQIFYPNLQYSI
ncbi:hypothetical protein PFISCL1PPCAC_10601, partial [Pristionchus fissidentatus]